jgi:hypothetical protein
MPATDTHDPARQYLKLMGMTPKSYKARCKFGRSRLWVIPPMAGEDQSLCTRCGVVSSTHPLSLATSTGQEG